jgi:hypothetical protein
MMLLWMRRKARALEKSRKPLPHCNRAEELSSTNEQVESRSLNSRKPRVVLAMRRTVKNRSAHASVSGRPRLGQPFSPDPYPARYLPDMSHFAAEL